MGKKRKKQLRKDEAVTYPFVFDFRGRGPFSKIDISQKKTVMELGCGIGAYTNALAAMHKDQQYIGVDYKAERIWRGAIDKEELGLENVQFIVGNIDYLTEWIPAQTIDEIWITFPDPQPRKKYEKKRLTSAKFLAMYDNVLKEGGYLHLKTDDPDFFEYSISNAEEHGWKVVTAIANIYAQKNISEELHIKTRFEEKWLGMGKDIFYVRFVR